MFQNTDLFYFVLTAFTELVDYQLEKIALILCGQVSYSSILPQRVNFFFIKKD